MTNPQRVHRARVGAGDRGHLVTLQQASQSLRKADVPTLWIAFCQTLLRQCQSWLMEKKRTTVMLRNMPNNYSRTMLVELLDAEGFAGQFDFLYLPMDFQSRASLGYAFINFTTSDAAEAFWRVFDGYSNWAIPSRKMSGVSWSGPHQGLEAHIERYRNSPVMAESTPDEYKPILFDQGVRIPFPAPTRRIRAPRVR